ncbi:S-adenosylmethionine:tRNA ribosyltransferase-isomerase [soil metagenome]
MHDPRKISILDYHYQLPEEKIAHFPIKNRDHSKLLVYKKGVINAAFFHELAEYLPDSAWLIFNNTRVVHARINFQKETGAQIEIFCLEPENTISVELAFKQTESVRWHCMLGNAKRWKEGILSKVIKNDAGEITLNAEKIQQSDKDTLIKFSWSPPHYSFSEILLYTGLLPLPPYMNRMADQEDELRYNTVYSKYEGSVAAPTAGLHFTSQLLNQLTAQNILTSEITLHVGAGTFKPVKALRMQDHEMHAERILVDLDFLTKLATLIDLKKVIPVGTTSMRTLESLYWFGMKLKYSTNENPEFFIQQWEPYQYQAEQLISPKEAIQLVVDYLISNDETQLSGYTQIIIAPGYSFKIADALITNFHQPGSTLLLLVAALIGERWKDVYDYALENNFRFLSYGDSSLLIP